MFRWTVSHTVVSQAKQETLWQIWTHVQGWPAWDDQLEWSVLNGLFENGARGSLKPKEMGVYTFTVTNIHSRVADTSDSREFTTITNIAFLTRMTDVHTVTIDSQRTVSLTQTVTVSGLLAPLLYFVMRKNVIQGLRQSLAQLSRLAEEKEAHG